MMFQSKVPALFLGVAKETWQPYVNKAGRNVPAGAKVIATVKLKGFSEILNLQLPLDVFETVEAIAEMSQVSVELSFKNGRNGLYVSEAVITPKK